MRALMLDTPPEMLEERHRKGLDLLDEVWDGVLHMVPPPTELHQRLATELLVLLAPLARRKGLRLSHDAGLFRASAGDRDYRVPDVIAYRPEDASKRGIEGRAELVIELLSPNDESREKLPFFESLGVREVWLLEPEARAVELYVLRGGRLLAALPDRDGAFRSSVLDLEFRTVAGPKLRVTWAEGSEEI